MKQAFRKCVVCRERAEKEKLQRFVYFEEKLVWDPEGRMTGRGAYIHPALQCVSRMTEPKIWEHAFRLGKGKLSKEMLKKVYDEIVKRWANLEFTNLQKS